VRDALIVTVMSCLPRNALASVMGSVARARISRWLTSLFVRVYRPNLDEAVVPDGGFPTLEALFTRRLRPDARRIASVDGWVSPVDGTVAFAGTTTSGRFEIAPGRRHTLSRLLDRPVEDEADVIVLYLSPTDYHRVHAPADGTVVGAHYAPGSLWPVFAPAVRSIDELFGRNERVIVTLTAEDRAYDLVLVGAFGVGRIGLAFHPQLTNAGAPAGPIALDGAPPMRAGDDLGCFHLGSTVVLVAPAGSLDLRVSVGQPVRLGMPLALWRRP
jgi:phosphatidylserine decarboxylase